MKPIFAKWISTLLTSHNYKHPKVVTIESITIIILCIRAQPSMASHKLQQTFVYFSVVIQLPARFSLGRKSVRIK